MVANPNQGYGESQPGSWAYSVLPFIEAENIRDIGSGVTNATELENLMKTVAETPIPSFNCPSRRPPVSYPYSRSDLGSLAKNMSTCTAGNCQLARCDYAGNSATSIRSIPMGPVPSLLGRRSTGRTARTGISKAV